MKVSDIGEFELINRITKGRQSHAAGLVGIGDDACVLPLSWIFEKGSPSGGSLVVTMDALVENVDFRLSYTSPRDIGWKLIAVNLSDLAAMGASPRAALINLQLPTSTAVSWVDELYAGIYECSDRYGVKVVGGDTGSGAELSLSATLIGYVNDSPLLRSGAQVGDDIWLSGTLGGPWLALQGLEGKEEMWLEYSKEEIDACKQKFFRPSPCVELGSYLSEFGLASSAIDVSDGFIQDLMHIAEASKMDMRFDFDNLPVDLIESHRPMALASGEDFELIFTSAPENRERLAALNNGKDNFSLSRVGNVLARKDGSRSSLVINSSNHGELAIEKFLDRLGLGKELGFQHFLGE